MGERLYPELHADTRLASELQEVVRPVQFSPIARELRGSVRHVLTYREFFPVGCDVLERVLPDATNRLIFNFGDIAGSELPSQSGAPVQVVGAWSRAALVTLHGQMDGISVSFLPGYLRAVLGVPAGEISGRVLNLDQLWGGLGIRLLQRMRREPDRVRRIRLLERAILERMRGAEPARLAAQAARLIETTNGKKSVGDVAKAVGVGERRLQQLFHEHVGLSPRTYSRVSRLQASLRALRGKNSVEWAKLASDCGYYDQAHLTNEFRSLTGLTPSACFNRAVAGSSKTTSQRPW